MALLRPHRGQLRLRRKLRRRDLKVLTCVLGRRWGKTNGAVDIITEALLEKPNRLEGWFANKFETVGLAWKFLLKRIPEAAIRRKNIAEHHLVLHNGSEFKGFSCEAADPGRGWGFHRAWLDEGARIPTKKRDEDIWATLVDHGGYLVNLTTPKGKKGSGAHVFRDFQKAKAKVPGYYWLQGPSWENPNPKIQEWIDWSRDNVPRAVFDQEFGARFLEDGSSILDLRGVSTGEGDEDNPMSLPFSFEPVEGHEYVAGLDLAQTTDWTVLSVADLETRQVVAMDRFHRMAWEVMVERAARTIEEYEAQVYVDATGVGRPIVELLDKHDITVQPVTFTGDVKTGLVQGLQVATERREYSMPWVAEAISEADMFEATPTASGRMKYSAADGFHDDIVISLALMVKGLVHGNLGIPV